MKYMSVVIAQHTKAFLVIFLMLLVCFQTQDLAAQSKATYSKAVQEKIKQFENNLGLWVQIEGQQFTLADRMKSNHINGISIALIKDYKIEWVKAYGWADSAQQRPVTTSTLFRRVQSVNR